MDTAVARLLVLRGAGPGAADLAVVRANEPRDQVERVGVERRELARQQMSRSDSVPGHATGAPRVGRTEELADRAREGGMLRVRAAEEFEQRECARQLVPEPGTDRVCWPSP